jgi:hypothetical protein
MAPEHEGIQGNEKAYQAVKWDLIGPEPACRISAEISNRTLRRLTNRNN